jgi:hypothetical protein
MVLPSFVTANHFPNLRSQLPSRQSTYGFQINLFKTDMLKSGVKPSIRRTGAELIDFLVFRNKFLKVKSNGQIVAKNGV